MIGGSALDDIADAAELALVLLGSGGTSAFFGLSPTTMQSITGDLCPLSSGDTGGEGRWYSERSVLVESNSTTNLSKLFSSTSLRSKEVFSVMGACLSLVSSDAGVALPVRFACPGVGGKGLVGASTNSSPSDLGVGVSRPWVRENRAERRGVEGSGATGPLDGSGTEAASAGTKIMLSSITSSAGNSGAVVSPLFAGLLGTWLPTSSTSGRDTTLT